MKSCGSFFFNPPPPDKLRNVALCSIRLPSIIVQEQRRVWTCRHTAHAVLACIRPATGCCRGNRCWLLCRLVVATLLLLSIVLLASSIRATTRVLAIRTAWAAKLVRIRGRTALVRCRVWIAIWRRTRIWGTDRPRVVLTGTATAAVLTMAWHASHWPLWRITLRVAAAILLACKPEHDWKEANRKVSIYWGRGGEGGSVRKAKWSYEKAV